MRTKIKAVLVLVGVAAAVVGAQTYLSVASGGPPITSGSGMINWFKQVGIASIMLVGGLVVVFRTVF
jgi:hypothetical protein